VFSFKKPEFLLIFFDNFLNDIQCRAVFSRQVLNDRKELVHYKKIAEKIDITLCFEVVPYISLACLNIIRSMKTSDKYKHYFQDGSRIMIKKDGVSQDLTKILFNRIIFLTSYSMIIDCPIRKISANLNKKLKNLKVSEFAKSSKICRKVMNVYYNLKFNGYTFDFHEENYI
jgi:hypothetical protein